MASPSNHHAPTRRRRRSSLWDTLPLNVADEIYSRMPFSSLKTLFLSLASRPPGAAYFHLQNIVLDRADAVVRLRELWQGLWDVHTDAWMLSWEQNCGGQGSVGRRDGDEWEFEDEERLMCMLARQHILKLHTLDDEAVEVLTQECAALCRLVVIRPRRMMVKLRTLPRALRLCTRLEMLHLPGQYLHKVDETILNLCALRSLDLSDNPLEKLPEDMGRRLPKLEHVDVRGCPLQSIPEKVLCNIDSNANTYAYMGDGQAVEWMYGIHVADTPRQDGVMLREHVRELCEELGLKTLLHACWQ